MKKKLYEVLGVPEGSVIEVRIAGRAESGFTYHVGAKYLYDPFGGIESAETMSLMFGGLEYRLLLEVTAVTAETNAALDAIHFVYPHITYVERIESEYSGRQIVDCYVDKKLFQRIYDNPNFEVLEPKKRYPLSPPENPWRRVVNIATAEVIEEGEDDERD